MRKLRLQGVPQFALKIHRGKWKRYLLPLGPRLFVEVRDTKADLTAIFTVVHFTGSGEGTLFEKYFPLFEIRKIS